MNWLAMTAIVEGIGGGISCSSTVDSMYATSEENKFLEVTYANGEKETLYFKDFASGALIEGIVAQSEKVCDQADARASEGKGFKTEDLLNGHPGGIQRARRPAQHDQPRRLGENSRQERAKRSSTSGRSAVARRNPARSKPSRRATTSKIGDLIGRRSVANESSRVGNRDGIRDRRARRDSIRSGLEFLPSSDSIPALPAPQAVWDYENENPLLDARGFEVEGERERPGPEYNRLLNKVLANGGRLYVDGAHPEYSTPECTNPREDRRVRTRRRADYGAMSRPTGARHGAENSSCSIKIIRTAKGIATDTTKIIWSRGRFPSSVLVQVLVPFLVTRPIYAGAGKVGAENQTSPAEYQISQRADFFECLVDLNTMVKRPIVNTRDEPHADPAKYRRLHVIVGDANMAELSTYLKVGTMADRARHGGSGRRVSVDRIGRSGCGDQRGVARPGR